ncbi:MAG: S-layer homology domain-containing protein [Acidimicrobiia bacterium]
MVILVLATLLIPGIGIASHTFTDVPNSNTHHDNITWLANAGVTEGCNPPANDMFCPSDPVKRAQMDSKVDCDGTCLGHYTKDADNSSGLNATYGFSKVCMVNVAAAGDCTFYVNAAVGVTGDTIWLWDVYASAMFVPGSLASSNPSLGAEGLALPLDGQS